MATVTLNTDEHGRSTAPAPEIARFEAGVVRRNNTQASRIFFTECCHVELIVTYLPNRARTKARIEAVEIRGLDGELTERDRPHITALVRRLLGAQTGMDAPRCGVNERIRQGAA